MSPKETLDAYKFSEVGDLVEVLLGVDKDYYGHTVYVTSADGAVFGRATLQRETLTDGSHVFNLVLSEV